MPYKDPQKEKERRRLKRDHINAVRRDWGAKNRERINAEQREWKAKNKSKVSEYNRRFRENHPERMKEFKRRDYQSHKSTYAAGHKRWREKNPIKAIARCLDWYQKNREQVLEKMRAEYAADPAIRARSKANNRKRRAAKKLIPKTIYHKSCRNCGNSFKTTLIHKMYCSETCAHQRAGKEWRRNNPEQTRLHCQNFRLRRRGKTRPLTKMEWNAVLEYYGNACAYCGRSDVPLDMEHIIPATRGGENDPYNVCPACEKCNSRKHADTLIEFLFLRKFIKKIPRFTRTADGVTSAVRVSA